MKSVKELQEEIDLTNTRLREAKKAYEDLRNTPRSYSGLDDMSRYFKQTERLNDSLRDLDHQLATATLLETVQAMNETMNRIATKLVHPPMVSKETMARLMMAYKDMDYDMATPDDVDAYLEEADYILRNMRLRAPT